MNHKKILLTLFAMLLLFGVFGCDGGGGTTADYFVGTEGISIKIPESQKITQVLEDSNLYSTLQVENKGTFDLNSYDENRYGFLTINYDNYYLSAITEVAVPVKNYGGFMMVDVPSNQKVQAYPEPSQYYPSGDKQAYEFNFKVNKLTGQRESPETSIIYTLCYPYLTTFSKEICIDADPFSLDERKKVCKSSDLSYSGGQGAPLAITRIEPIMSKSGTTIRPTFRIYVRNQAEGSVLNYVSGTKEKIHELCKAANIDHLDWNKVHVNAELSGKALECTPELIYLKRDEDSYTVCKVKDENLNDKDFVQASNYKANLNIWLSYIYISSISQKVEIIRG
jgi:hypothetical protein